MSQPQMDINRLKGILGKSRELMGTVESGNFKKGNIDRNLLVQEAVEHLPGGYTPPQRSYSPPQQQTDPGSEMYKARVQSSKMPEAVKQAMIKNPIAPPDMSAVLSSGAGRTFTLEDLGYTSNSKPQLNEQMQQPRPMQESIPQMQPPQQQYYQQPPQQYYAPPAQPTPTISRDEIKSIIKECLAEMMVNTITEHSVKNTLKSLVSEGKIKLTKKK